MYFDITMYIIQVCKGFFKLIYEDVIFFRHFMESILALLVIIISLTCFDNRLFVLFFKLTNFIQLSRTIFNLELPSWGFSLTQVLLLSLLIIMSLTTEFLSNHFKILG